MKGTWIITTKGIIVCILITWTCALPLLQKAGGDQESDETESDEDETTTVRNRSQNVSDQELTDKATQFLTRYFSNYGTESPLHIPTNLNHTIVISVVPNSNGLANNYVLVTSEGPPTFVGDIHLFQPQQQQYEQQHQQQVQAPSTNSQAQYGTLTPVKDLFGFVSKDQASRISSNRGSISTSSPEPFKDTAAATTTTTTTTTTPLKEEPVDNIEDAILEALSIAGGGSGQQSSSSSQAQNSPSSSGSLSPANANYQALLQSGAIPGLPNNQGVIQVPSNFGTVFIESEGQSTITPNIGGTIFVNQNTPAPPTNPPPPPPPTAPAVPKIVYVNPYIVQQNPDNDNEAIPPGSTAIKAVSGIIGSISEGNLGTLVQNTVRLAEAPAVQNAAKLATVAILHNVFQGFNCNLLGNCNNRPRPSVIGKK